MIYGWSCTKIPSFVPVEQTKWPPEQILYFDWPIFQKSSSIKLLGQIQPNFARMINGWSSTKLPHFVPVEQTKWPPEQILYFDWPIFKNLLLWNYWTEFNQTLQEWSMDGPAQNFLILFRLNKQNGRQSRFFILIGRFSKIFFYKTTGPNLTKLCKND